VDGLAAITCLTLKRDGIATQAIKNTRQKTTCRWQHCQNLVVIKFLSKNGRGAA